MGMKRYCTRTAATAEQFSQNSQLATIKKIVYAYMKYGRNVIEKRPLSPFAIGQVGEN